MLMQNAKLEKSCHICLRKVIDGQRKRLKRMREALNMKQKRKSILQKEEAMTIL
jgi:hypothetical protein